MKISRNCFFLGILLGSNSLWAQSLDWATQYDSYSARAIITDPANNVYFGGSFRNTIDFDFGPGLDTITANIEDGFLTKLSDAGIYQWTFQLDAPGNNSQQSINGSKMDAGNNVYLAADFSTDAVGALKLSPAGAELWRCVFKYNTPSLNHFNECTDIALDISGNSIITGYFWQHLTYPNSGFPYWFSQGEHDVFIFKMDSIGNFLWGKMIGGPEDEKAYSVATDDSGNVYCIGMFEGTCDFDPDTADTYNLSASSDWDTFIVKLNPDGEFIWVKTFETDILYSFPKLPSIEIDDNQDIFISATGYSGTDLDPGPGVQIIPFSSGGFKSFILKLNSFGDFIWAKTFTKNTYSTSLSLDPSGNILHSGYFEWTSMDLDPGPDSAMIYSLNSYPDGYFIKLNHSGQYLSGGMLASNLYCKPSVIYSGFPGQTYVIGAFKDTLDIDPSPGFVPLIHTVGWEDLFLAKYGGCSYVSNTTNLNSCGPLSYNGQWYNNSGTFYQTFQDISGCDSILALNITIHTIPSTEIIGNNVLCNGIPLMFETSNSFPSYSWSTGDTTEYILVNTPGTYFVVVTDINGCTGTDSIIVTQQTLPIVTINAQSATVFCQGDSVILAATPALTSYQWYIGNQPIPTATMINFTAKTQGKYRCIAQNAALCSDTSNIISVRVPCIFTGPNNERFTKNEERNPIIIYPNPSSGIITIEGFHNRIDVSNSLGKLVYDSKSIEDKRLLDLSEFPNGLYTIRIFSYGMTNVSLISISR